MVNNKFSILRHLTNSETFEEQRKTTRLDVPIKIQYRIIGNDSDFKDAVAKNISVKGCLILITEKLLTNTPVELKIYLTILEKEDLKVKGEIVRLARIEKDLFEFGVCFEKLNKEQRDFFINFCFEKMYEKIGLINWPTKKRP
ncbi:PilZ domain-containing protein [Candidatus Poribacteria bacterium]|nr:PilZ domain-containing protein [Candidatus Poribacteria bacterium]